MEHTGHQIQIALNTFRHPDQIGARVDHWTRTRRQFSNPIRNTGASLSLLSFFFSRVLGYCCCGFVVLSLCCVKPYYLEWTTSHLPTPHIYRYRISVVVHEAFERPLGLNNVVDLFGHPHCTLIFFFVSLPHVISRYENTSSQSFFLCLYRNTVQKSAINYFI